MSEDEQQSDEAEFPPTAPPDARFPNTNQTNYCYTMYLDFQKCTRLFGDDHEPCSYFQRTFRSLCPNQWVEKWDRQIEEGVFAHPLPPKQGEGEQEE